MQRLGQQLVVGDPQRVSALGVLDPAALFERAGSDTPALLGRPALARFRAMAEYMRRFDLVLSYSFKNGTSGMSAHFTKVERDGGMLVATVQTNYGTKAGAAPAVIVVARQGIETVEFRDPNGRLLHRDTVK